MIVPGQITSSGPALAGFGNQLYVGFQGNGTANPSNAVNIMYSGDGLNWATFLNGPAIPGQTTTSGPALAAFPNQDPTQSKLYVAFRGDGDNTVNIMSSADGQNWGDFLRIPGQTTQGRPALSVFPNQNKLYVAFQGNGSSRPSYTVNIMSSSDGESWDGFLSIPGQTTSAGPALAYFNNKLYVAFRGNGSSRPSHTVNIMSSSDGENWDDFLSIPGQTTSAGPALAVYNGMLYVAFRGDGDDTINVMSSRDGQNWSGFFRVAGQTTAGGPALVAFNNMLYVGWQGMDTQHSLNVAQILAPNWMQSNLGTLDDLPLEELCMPGSHDAGMSQFGTHTAFSTACNTQTQGLSLYNQLLAGVRYFDIRPVISAGVYKTGHYSHISVIGWQGGNGELIADIIDDINTFTASYSELIVLNSSHGYDTDNDYQNLTQAQWNSLFQQLRGLSHLFIAPPAASNLTNLTLGDFIGNDNPAVVVVLDYTQDGSTSGITLGGYASQGFYTNGTTTVGGQPYSATSLNVYNEYSNTDSLSFMESDQLAKMQQNALQPGRLFLLSFTLTQQGAVAPCILEQAATAVDPALPGWVIDNCSAALYPNILFEDAVGTDNAQVAVYINSNYAP